MNRVMRTLTKLTGLSLGSARREGGSLACWIALIAVLETVEPYASTDAMDALAVTALLAAVWTTVRVHRARPLQWLSPLTSAVARMAGGLREFGIEFGVDMREDPPLRRGWPKLIWALLAGSTLVFAGAALGYTRWPEALRGLAVLSYVLYLFTLGALWAALLGGVLFSGGITLCALHDAVLDARHRYRLGLGGGWILRVRESSYGMLLLSGVLIASFLLPAAVAIGLIASLWLIHTILLGITRVQLPLLWKDEHGQPRVLPWIASGISLTTIALLVIGAPTLLAIGDELPFRVDEVEGAMPITRVLGRLFAWSALCAYTTMFYLGAKVVRLWMAFRRARSAPRQLCVNGLEDAAQRRELEQELKQRGWRVRFDGRGSREALEVCIEVNAQLPEESFFGPSWPEAAPPAWLVSEEGLRKLDRRWQMRQRRRLVRGLKSLFKGISARTFERGEGTWVAPNLWYVTGLARDTNEEAFEHADDYLLDERIGPSFAEVFSWSTRAHFHEVMRALEVDLIFVEDGVRFRRFRRVLDTLFEVYDIHAGAQRAEERHFAGLPGLSVILVDIGLEDSLDSDKFPEPDYEDVGRARILHVFLERGGDEQEVTVPEDTSWVPTSPWGPLLPA